MATYIGLDPGLGGGIALLDSDGAVVGVHRMPDHERELYDLLRGRVDAHAVLEKVHSTPQMGRASAFTFGRGYGALRMALVAAGIPFDEVSSQKWQKAMNIPFGKGRKVGSTDRKNVTKARAQELFPSQKVTHAIADALLLASYARRMCEGGL
jgi:hypothetical protein